MTESIPPTKGPHFSDMGSRLRQARTDRDKVRIVMEEYGEVSKDILLQELEQFGITRKKLTNVIKDLKKRSEIQSVRRGWYTNGVTIRVAPIGESDTNATHLKWFSEAVRFHNVKGKLIGVDVGSSKWGSDLKSSIKQKVPGTSGYVILIRNYNTIQFVFANKRPAFDRTGLLAAIATLYEMLVELNLNGTAMIHYFEARNSRKMRIHGLEGKPYTLKLVAGLVAKAYQDGDELQTEIIGHGLAFSMAEMINTANALRSNTQVMAAQNTIAAGVKKTNDLLNGMRTDQRDHIYETEGTLNQVAKFAEKTMVATKETAEYMDYVDSRLFELTQSMGDLKNEQLKDDVKLGFKLLVDKVNFLSNKLDKREEEEKKWRDLDTNRRIQTLNELLEVSNNISNISDIVGAHRSTIYRFLDDYKSQINYTKCDKRVTPMRHKGDPTSSDTRVTPLLDEKIIIQFMEIITKNPGINNSKLRIKSEIQNKKLKPHLDEMVRRGLIRNGGGSGQRGYSWQINNGVEK